MNRTSIFYRLTNENENSSTELLCNLLRTKYVRDICLKFLGIPENILDKINYNNIIRQKKIGESAIFDIRIEGNDYYYINEVLDYFCKLMNISSCEDNKLTPYEVAMFYNPKDIFNSINCLQKINDIIEAVEIDILKIFNNLLVQSQKWQINDLKPNNSKAIGKSYNYAGMAESIFIGLSLDLLNNNEIYFKNDKNNKVDDYIFSVAIRKSQFNIEKINNYCDDQIWIYIPLNKKILIDDNEENIKENLKKEIKEILENVFSNNIK
jgi:hypothetical protein